MNLQFKGPSSEEHFHKVLVPCPDLRLCTALYLLIPWLLAEEIDGSPTPGIAK